MSKVFKKGAAGTEAFTTFRFGETPETNEAVSSFFALEEEKAAPAARGEPPPKAEAAAEAAASGPMISQAAMESMIMDIQRKAYEEGFAHGERQGVKMGEEKLKAMYGQFEDLFREISQCKEHLFREAERDVLHLSLEIARKLVRKEVRVDEEILQTLVQITLGKVARHSKVKIYLHPADHKALTRNGEALDRFRLEFDALDLVADDKIEVGGCLVESSSGLLDARISEQFREVEKELLELLPGV